MQNRTVSAFALKRKNEIDMTEGSVVKNIVKFALPLLAGNLFQQLYNMVDMWVIGQTGDNGAFAAVGSVGPITNIMIGFFAGLASGAGVVISQYYGARNKEKVKRSVHTSLMMTFIIGVFFTIAGILLTPAMVKLMLSRGGIQENGIYSSAVDYLTIYIGGIMSLMIYNMGSGILRAVGDSRRPFYFLIVSALTNTGLDLLFVHKFGMGVKGVAIATVAAQTLSAILIVVTLLATDSSVKVRVKDLCIDMYLLKKIVKIGIPAALQMAITAFANVFVQSYISGINGVQDHVMGGWTTYSKIDQFIFLPIQSIGLAATTFVGQNLGVGNVQRAKRGTKLAFIMSLSATVIIMIPTMIFAPHIARFIKPDDGVVHYSVLFIRYLSPFYICCSVNQIFACSLRGAGNSRAPMIIMLSSFVAFRQVYLFVMSNFISNDALAIGFSYPAGWILCSILMLVYFSRFKFENTNLTT